jgi:hypothetical protein
MLFRHADVEVTYETGGVDFRASDLNMNRFQNIILTPVSDTYAVRYDFDAEEIHATTIADGSEVSASTTFDLRVTGIGR